MRSETTTTEALSKLEIASLDQTRMTTLANCYEKLSEFASQDLQAHLVNLEFAYRNHIKQNVNNGAEIDKALSTFGFCNQLIALLAENEEFLYKESMLYQSICDTY